MEPTWVETDFTAYVSSLNDRQRGAIEYTAHYDSSYLEGDNLVQNNDLALFAFAMANSAIPERAKDAFAGAGFDEHTDFSTLEEEITFDSIGYAIGSRKVNGVDQIVVAIRSENYTKEWDSNFTLVPEGEDPRHNGDHFGFRLSAMKVIAGVKSFVENNGIKKASYLFTGFSRGAAVASLSAAMMVDSPIACDKTAVYGYTFEGPAGMLKEHNKDDYNCIFNYVNENDLIAMFAPASYGFCRPGRDVIISEGLTAYDPILEKYGVSAVGLDETSDFSFLGLTDQEGNPTNSGKAAFHFLIGIITRELSENDVSKGVASLHTVGEFVAHLQKPIHSFVRNLMTWKPSITLDAVFSALGPAVDLIYGLSADDGFFPASSEGPYNKELLWNFFHEFFKAAYIYPEGEEPEGELPEGVTLTHYDAEELKSACYGAQELLRNIQLGLTAYYYQKGYDIDTARGMLVSIAMSVASNVAVVSGRHTYDTGYATLRNYVDKAKAGE